MIEQSSETDKADENQVLVKDYLTTKSVFKSKSRNVLVKLKGGLKWFLSSPFYAS